MNDPRLHLRALLDACPGEQVTCPRAWLLPLVGEPAALGPIGPVPANEAGAPEGGASADRLLDAETAAERLGVKVGWLYRHWHTIPGAVKLGRRTLRFSEAGITRYLAARRRATGRAA